jgi:hypothetical protein
VDLLGKESCSSSIGGIAYRDGYFSIWNDPAKFGLFYHAALMLRRGDVQPAKKIYGAKMSELPRLQFKAFSSMVERSQIHTIFDDSDLSDIDEIVTDTDNIRREDSRRIISDTGELRRDLFRSVGVVDSPRTQIAYGFLGRYTAEDTQRRESVNLGVNMQSLKVDCYTDFATVALSSLTDDPICESDHMLLSTIGRARNTGAQFDGEKMLDIGRPPIVSEVIEADLAVKTKYPTMTVWAVNSDGYYVGKIPTTYEDGWLKFHVGPHYPAPYYLLVKE